MKRLILLLAAAMVLGTIMVSYGFSGSQSEPVGEPPTSGEAYVADASGALLKCNGKLAKVKVGGPPAAVPFGGSDPTLMDRGNSKKIHTYGCQKKNGKDTGEVVLVEAP